jgi:hypothetical protein
MEVDNDDSPIKLFSSLVELLLKFLIVKDIRGAWQESDESSSL